MLPTGVSELEGLSYLEGLAEEYRSRSGAAPFNLSLWDPSEFMMNSLLKFLRLPVSPLPIPYIYSDEESKQQVLERLGFVQSRRICAFVQAGTNAGLLAAVWLKALNFKRTLVLCPAYFSIFYALEILNVPHQSIYMARKKGNWYLPHEKIEGAIGKKPSQTAIWLTNPVYCTGNYRSASDIEFLKMLLHRGVTVIADECLCINGRELGRELAWSDKFVGIYSPHKSVSVNAVKFATVVADESHERFFDHWTDVIVGSLTASNYSAISHFIGENFPRFLRAFIEHTDRSRDEVMERIRRFHPLIETDDNAVGHYITCYAPQVTGDEAEGKKILQGLMSETGALVIPGAVNHFPRDIGFNFRINLARAGPQFFAAFQRTLNYLTSMSAEA
jgi:aspartate/methionine/tyrosine aminotransferase